MNFLLLISLIGLVKGYMCPCFLLDLKMKIIENTANILPKLDTVGHNLLLKDKELITNILESDKLPVFLKKGMVLDIIKITQLGDEFGGKVLSKYFELVNKLL
tara:strand:- start:106 stop:414 length:309 start_codon:yes stop_codon:yes gene_type:complete